MYQVGEPISENAGDEQSSQRLFRRIPAQIPSGPSALLIDRSRRLTGLASHLASDTLNSIPGLRNRLTTGCRYLAHQGSGLSQCFSSACLKTLEHVFALIELPFCRVADLSPPYRSRHPQLAACPSISSYSYVARHPSAYKQSPRQNVRRKIR
jgi:hypothetical protein